MHILGANETTQIHFTGWLRQMNVSSRNARNRIREYERLHGPPWLQGRQSALLNIKSYVKTNFLPLNEPSISRCVVWRSFHRMSLRFPGVWYGVKVCSSFHAFVFGLNPINLSFKVYGIDLYYSFWCGLLYIFPGDFFSKRSLSDYVLDWRNWVNVLWLKSK